MNSDLQPTTGSFRAWLHQRTVLYALLGILAGFAFPIIAAGIKLGELHMPLTVHNLFAVQGMEPVLWITDTAPIFLGLLAAIAGRREDLHLQENNLRREREAELDAVRQSLDDKISERARQLDQRNAQMRSVVTFARQVADIQDLPTLLSTSARMISERFERCDVDLFLLDENRQSAVLKASSSASGAELIKNGHRVAVGDPSAVGRVARRGTALISPLRAESPGEAAPASGNEITLPMAVRGRVIGVLEAHTKGSQSGSQTEADMLQLLADQLAASIENARLVSESRAAIQQLEAAGSQSTRFAWQQLLKKSSIAYQLTPAGVRPATSFSSNGSSGGLKVPLKLRGQEIGSISVKRSSDSPWKESERELMEKMAAQVALAVENARLMEETRQRAAQEQLIGEVSARFSRSLDVEALLQAAVREFAALPEVAEATVVLKPPAEPGTQGRN